MNTEKSEKNQEAQKHAKSVAQMEKILQKQNELNVLQPAGSRKYRDWNSVPQKTPMWSSQNKVQIDSGG